METKQIEENKETVSIDRFDAGTEAKLIKALSKLFRESNNCTESDAVALDNCSCVDPANVCMVSGKTEKAKRCLSRFVDKTNQPKIPAFNIEGNTSNFSSDYFVSLINVLKVTNDYMTFTVGHDAPGKFENEHFSFLLAPRIVED